MVKRGVKGQVSLFMLVGVAILIAVGILVYLRSQGPSVVTSDIPDELLPIQAYVNECLERVGNEAVMLVGAQGGYTKVPEDIANDPQAHLAVMGEFKLPYWYRNNRNAIPSNQEVEQEIANYVAARLGNCINGFKPFKDTYEVTEISQAPVPAIAIKEGSVDVGISYTIDVAYPTGRGRLDSFHADIPIRLGRVLRLARELLLAENRQAWLEQRTIDLMASLPDSKIPFTSIGFSCVPMTWTIDGVESELKQLLKYNLPRIRVQKTNFMPFERELNYYLNPSAPYPTDVAEYAMLLWNPLSEDFADLKIGVGYLPNWGMTMVVRPSSGNDMRSTSVQGGSYSMVDLTGACIQFYHFTYDITYPVRVSIYDEKSSGYSFSYAFPVIVKDNHGWRNSEPYTETELSESEDFCSDLEQPERSVFVQDAKTFDRLKNVSVSFSCIRYVCKLGQTDEQFGRLFTDVPAGCSGGILTAEKNGYLKTKTQLGNAQTTNIYMLPLVKLNVSVLKFDNSSKSYSALSGEERASLYLSLVGGDQELYSLVLPGTSPGLGLVDANAVYKLRLYIFDGETLVGGYSLDNWKPGNLAGLTSVDFYSYHFPGKDQSEIIRLISRNSTMLEPKVRR